MNPDEIRLSNEPFDYNTMLGQHMMNELQAVLVEGKPMRALFIFDDGTDVGTAMAGFDHELDALELVFNLAKAILIKNGLNMEIVDMQALRAMFNRPEDRSN